MIITESKYYILVFYLDVVYGIRIILAIAYDRNAAQNEIKQKQKAAVGYCGRWKFVLRRLAFSVMD